MAPEGTTRLSLGLTKAVKAGETLLRSYGQFLFADQPVTGAAMALGLALISSGSLLFSGFGILIGCGAAVILKKEPQKIARGLYGFNPGLFGLFWSWYFQCGLISLGLFFVLATGLAFVQLGLERRLPPERTGIPFSSLPAVLYFLLLLYPIYWVTVQWQWLPASAVYLPLGSDFSPLIDLPLLRNEEAAFIREYYLQAWAVILLGVLYHSRISFWAALYGLAAGWLMVRLAPAALNSFPAVFPAFNALPLAMALYGVFLAATWEAFLFMNAALVLCGLIWVGSVAALEQFYLPYLTLPFNLTLVGAMAFLRTKGRGRNGLFAPGLHELDSAEKVLKTYRASAAGRKSVKIFSVSRSRPRRPSPEPEDTDVRFMERLAQSKRISVLSGAGTSTESGIPDIRGRSPFWEQFRPEIFVLSHFLGCEDVRMNYWAMDGLFLRLVRHASPNGIHRAIKRLQDQGRLECVVTQNVDGLFQRAGIRPEKTIEIHGSCFRVRCLACRTVYGRSELGLSYGLVRGVPRCPRCRGILKPDTVWMGEDVNPVLLGEAIYRFCASDLLLVIGTTLLVEPVASLPRVALEKGVELAIVNLTPTPFDAQSALVIREQAGGFFERSGLA